MSYNGFISICLGAYNPNTKCFSKMINFPRILLLLVWSPIYQLDSDVHVSKAQGTARFYSTCSPLKQCHCYFKRL